MQLLILINLQFFQELVSEVEKSRTPKVKVLCEPQMGKRNLYPTTSIVGGGNKKIGDVTVRQLMNVISFADGQHNFEELASKCQMSVEEVASALRILESEDLIEY